MGKYSEIFVAFDVAKKKHAVAIAESGRNGEVRFLRDVENSRLPVERTIKRLADRYDRLHIGFEAGPTGYGLCRQIQGLHMHFTPTSSSWINQVERFFGLITTRQIRGDVFRSVAELETTIMDYLDRHNANPKPFVWTKSATDILKKVAKAKQALESQH